jgi:hypothetical protein
MARLVTVITSIAFVLIIGGWLLQNALPAGPKILPMSPVVDQGIPLTRIVLPAAAPIVSVKEAAAVTAWWRRQAPDLIMAAQALIPRAPAPSELSESADLYAYDGLLGRCEFDANGALRFCERKPSGILPIIIPHDDASRRRLPPEAVHELAVRMLRLRDSTSQFWDAGAFAESDEAPWERDGEGWARTVTTISTDRQSGTTSDLRLAANGSVRDARTISWQKTGEKN